MKSIPILIIVCTYSYVLSSSPLKAFYGAEGFGSFAKGGRGGDVYVVTTIEDYKLYRDEQGNWIELDESHPEYLKKEHKPIEGSLRYGIMRKDPDTPRTILFNISGTINLKCRLFIAKISNLTINGKTAPEKGVWTKNYPVIIKNSNNIVIRYFRSRPGNEDVDLETKAIDAIGIYDSRDMIIDHCSLSWSFDEAISTAGICDNITIQNCIISEPIYNELLHEHNDSHTGFGAVFVSDNNMRLSFLNNIIAHTLRRAPRFKPQVNGIIQSIEIVNNIIYNSRENYGVQAWPRERPEDSVELRAYSYDLNLIKNYFKTKNEYIDDVKEKILTCIDISPGGVYIEDNYFNGSHAGVGAIHEDCNDNIKPKFSYMPTITAYSAQEAFSRVLTRAGAIYPQRDEIDERIVSEIDLGIGDLKGTPPEHEYISWKQVTSSDIHSDEDGIPDSQEKRLFLNPLDVNDGLYSDFDGDGYTNLEEYLNGTYLTSNDVFRLLIP